MVLPREYKSRMIFSDLRVFYQTVYPKDEGSPLIMDIDETSSLQLKYNQNIFSLQVSSINYDYPSLILYSWNRWKDSMTAGAVREKRISSVSLI